MNKKKEIKFWKLDEWAKIFKIQKQTTSLCRLFMILKPELHMCAYVPLN